MKLLGKLITERIMDQALPFRKISFERGLFIYDKKISPVLAMLQVRKTILVQDNKLDVSNMPKKIRYEINRIESLVRDQQIYIKLRDNVPCKSAEFLKEYSRKSYINLERLLRLQTEGKLKTYEFIIQGKLAAVFVWYTFENINSCRLIYNVNNYELISGKFAGLVKYGYYHSIKDLQNNKFKRIDLGGVSNGNNGIDRTKRLFLGEEVKYYNYIGIRLYGF